MTLERRTWAWDPETVTSAYALQYAESQRGAQGVAGAGPGDAGA